MEEDTDDLPQQPRVQHEDVRHGQHDEVNGGVGAQHLLARQDGDGHDVAQGAQHEKAHRAHAPDLLRHLCEVLNALFVRVSWCGGRGV